MPSGGGARDLVHDLASPLAAIKVSAHALRASEKLNARNLADVRRIEEAVSMVARMAESWSAPRQARRILVRAPASSETLVDLYVVCCDLAKMRRRIDGTIIHCRAFGDPRGAWDRQEVTRVLADVLDHAASHLGDRAPLAIVVTGMARHVRVDVHGFGWLSPAKRQVFLDGLSKIGSTLEHTTVSAAVASNAGSVFRLRLPK